jgi:putative inorganic carbon (hco3(-)) transporter
MTFALYLLYIISDFLHLGARVPFLGSIRFDLLLVLLIAVLIFTDNNSSGTTDRSDTSRLLLVLFVFVVLAIPFAEWPGTAIKIGMPRFIKAIVYFYFTVKLVRTERELKAFLLVFMAVQTTRVLEPLYLNITEGYWGSFTHMGNWEFMDRLSGGPHDIINSNGLAFVITSMLPFYYYLGSSSNVMGKIIYFGLIPPFLYALILTASRSGFLALMIIFGAIFVKSNHKILLLVLLLIGTAVLMLRLNDLQKDRYLSITQRDVRGAETASSRIDGVINDFMVALRKPFVGHGIGTSLEVNANMGGKALIAHNLYAEIMQEIGSIGLIIFIYFIRSIVLNFRRSAKYLKEKVRSETTLLNTTHAMEVWLWMNILFSFASYGLSSYEWYLFGGLSVVIRNIIGTKYAEILSNKALPELIGYDAESKSTASLYVSLSSFYTAVAR